jgi:hypothetical protein
MNDERKQLEIYLAEMETILSRLTEDIESHESVDVPLHSSITLPKLRAERDKLGVQIAKLRQDLKAWSPKVC